MNVKKIFSPPRHSTFGDVALLLIRVMAGIAFILHGWGKIQHPFDWMGEKASVPGIFQALAALAEFGGGIAWILGLLTPIASFGIACTMIVAVYMHAVMLGDPFVAAAPGGGSYEPAAGYLCIAIVFMALGPGKFSIDRAVFGPR